MARGKWFLMCTQFDSMKVHDHQVDEQTELAASTEENAVPEAQARWRSKLARAYRGGDDKIYPNCPRLIFEPEMNWPSA